MGFYPSEYPKIWNIIIIIIIITSIVILYYHGNNNTIQSNTLMHKAPSIIKVISSDIKSGWKINSLCSSIPIDNSISCLYKTYDLTLRFYTNEDITNSTPIIRTITNCAKKSYERYYYDQYNYSISLSETYTISPIGYYEIGISQMLFAGLIYMFYSLYKHGMNDFIFHIGTKHLLTSKTSSEQSDATSLELSTTSETPIELAPVSATSETPIAASVSVSATSETPIELASVVAPIAAPVAAPVAASVAASVATSVATSVAASAPVPKQKGSSSQITDSTLNFTSDFTSDSNIIPKSRFT